MKSLVSSWGSCYTTISTNQNVLVQSFNLRMLTWTLLLLLPTVILGCSPLNNKAFNPRHIAIFTEKVPNNTKHIAIFVRKQPNKTQPLQLCKSERVQNYHEKRIPHKITEVFCVDHGCECGNTEIYFKMGKVCICLIDWSNLKI